ncbi:MAG: 5-formyltetrahydrofolate cyclo-ligase [Polyangiales bacterium]
MSASETEHADRELRHRAKQALRNQMRMVRSALPQSACEARSAEIRKRLFGVAELQRAATVLAFASIRNEVRTRPIIEEAWSTGKRVALPRVHGDELCLHLIDSETPLVQGAFSVPEPPEDAARIGPDNIDFALIPALALDPRGYRIGYGGGYYDRLIPRLSDACTCAVAYDFQLISEVPELPFDVSVDLVITDSRVIRTV